MVISDPQHIVLKSHTSNMGVKYLQSCNDEQYALLVVTTMVYIYISYTIHIYIYIYYLYICFNFSILYTTIAHSIIVSYVRCCVSFFFLKVREGDNITLDKYGDK